MVVDDTRTEQAAIELTANNVALEAGSVDERDVQVVAAVVVGDQWPTRRRGGQRDRAAIAKNLYAHSGIPT